MGDWFTLNLLDIKLTGFDFATTSSPPGLLSCIDPSKWYWDFQLKEKWVQEHIEGFKMSNKRTRWTFTVDLFFSTCAWWVFLEERNTWYHHIPQIKSGSIINAQTSIQRHNFRFCWIARDWRLILTHPACGNTCSIRKISPEVGLESSTSPANSESWNRPNRQCWAVLPTCDECRKSNELSVCHKLLSILWLLLQVCLRTKESHANQF